MASVWYPIRCSQSAGQQTVFCDELEFFCMYLSVTQMHILFRYNSTSVLEKIHLHARCQSVNSQSVISTQSLSACFYSLLCFYGCNLTVFDSFWDILDIFIMVTLWKTWGFSRKGESFEYIWIFSFSAA